MLAVFDMLRKKGIVKKMLVVSNRRIIYNVWRQEVNKWNLPYTVSLVHGQSKNVAGIKKKERALDADADIYLINFEALTWLITRPRQLKKFAGGMLVADESSKIKTWKRKRTKALKSLLPLFKRRYIMSGCPTPKSLMDLYAQIYMLDMGKALGRIITEFRNSYFYQYGEKAHGLYGLLEGSEEKIYAKIKNLVIRFSEDELDLPPLIEMPRRIELPPDARRIYNELEQDFITFLKTCTLTVANAGAAQQKLRQF